MSFAETIMAETSMKCSSPEMRLERNFRKVPKIEVGYLTLGKYLVTDWSRKRTEGTEQ